MISRLDYLYQLAIQRGDLKLAAHIEISKGKLTIGEKQEVKHSGEVTGFNIIISKSKSNE